MKRLIVLIAAGYLMTAGLTFRLADVDVRPLFDGPHDGQIPYRWVNPPPEEEPFNLPPESGRGSLELTRNGSRDDDVQTLDLQAGAVFPPQAFDPKDGEDQIVITIEPLDPATVGPPPPGQEHQGNAYRITATYGSGDPAPLAAEDCDVTAEVFRCPSVFLTVPFGANDVARWDGSAWVLLPEPTETNSVVFADTTELGIFVGLAEEGRIAAALALRNQVPSGGFPLRDVIAIVLGGIAAVGATVLYRRRMTALRREEVKRRAAGPSVAGPRQRAAKTKK